MNYDIIVIGAGSGGLNIAMFMNKAGFKVLLIDKSDRSIGGDCLNHGCVPSKALIHLSRMAYEAKSMSPYGVKVSGDVDLSKVMQYVDDKKEFIREHENAAYFRGLGLDVQLGVAKFTGKNSVSVNGDEHTAKRIVLATGSRPRKMEAPGMDKVQYLTNENLFSLKKLPKNFLVIGGGPIGLEIAQAFARLGSKVTVVEYLPKFLPKEREDIGQVLYKQLEREGISFYFNSRIKEFPTAKSMTFSQVGSEKEITIKFDEVLVSVGRVLNTENLDLEKAGIEMDGHRVKCDDYLRTTNKNVYLCGDIAGSFQFTHAAELHAGVIISNFFSPFKKKLSNDKLSWVTYTYPEIATFGLSEDVLKQRNVSYEVISQNFDHDDRSIVDNYTEGKLVLFVSKGKILGGSMVAPNAGELFQELVLAMSSGLNVKHLFNKVYPYPTASRINKRTIMQLFSKKLTPFSKKVLQFLY